MSSFSIVDDNDKLKYKLTSVPIFEKSQTAWNNSIKTNAFTINSPNQSVLFTGNLSCLNVVPRIVTVSYANIDYAGVLTFPPYYGPISIGMFVIGPNVPPGTYITYYYAAGDSYQLSQQPYEESYGQTYTLVEINNFDHYLNPPIQLPLEIIIRFNLHGTTNYIYQNIKFTLDYLNPNSNFFLPINFIKTFPLFGQYDVYIYINGTDFITNSNDFLNLNATLYDLIIPPEDNFEL